MHCIALLAWHSENQRKGNGIANAAVFKNNNGSNMTITLLNIDMGKHVLQNPLIFNLLCRGTLNHMHSIRDCVPCRYIPFPCMCCIHSSKCLEAIYVVINRYTNMIMKPIIGKSYHCMLQYKPTMSNIPLCLYSAQGRPTQLLCMVSVCGIR